MPKADLVKFLPKLVFKEGSMPLYLTFFVTNKCNLTCEHCFYSAELNLPTQELSLEEIEKMAKSMDPFPVLLYSGGEPFIRKDLAEVTHMFYKYNKVRYLSIPTNGSFLKWTEPTVEKMCTLCPDMTIVLNFSIDGLEEEHNRIRGGKDTFKKAMETFHTAKTWKKKFPNLRTGFVCTFTATNQDHIEELYDFLRSQGPDNISINLIRGTPKDPIVKNIDIEKFKRVTERVRKDLADTNMPGYDDFVAAMGHNKYEMVIKTYESHEFQTVCYASKIAAVLYPNGDVYPCEMLDKSKMIGNIRKDFDMDFRKLWESKRNKEIADWVVDTKCFCTHECNVHCNIAFNPKYFAKTAARAGVMRAKKMLHLGSPAPAAPRSPAPADS